MSDGLDLLAAEYALGLLDQRQEAEAREAMATNPEFRRKALAWEESLGPLISEEDGPSGEALWAQIEARLDERDDSPGTRTVAAAEGVWEVLGRGIRRKVVHVDRAAGSIAFLVRMRAGAVLPAHDHAHDEHCVVLEGELKLGGAIFGAGTYHFASRDRAHMPISAVRDSLFFIHGALE